MNTSSAPSLVKYIPPYPSGMPAGLIIILQVIWIKAMLRLGRLEAKVNFIEGGMKPWVDP